MTGRVIVIGAGIAGQTAAFRLCRNGHDVVVLEANPTLAGGEMSSVSIGPWTFNRGATILPDNYHQLIRLADELGLSHKFQGTMPAIFAVPRDGKVHQVRGSGMGAALDMLRTPLLSLRAKLTLARLGMDVAKAKRFIDYEKVAPELDVESIGDYCRRRLNPEAATYLLGALARGAYLYEPETLSMLDFYFAAVKFSGISFLRYEDGIGFLNRALAEVLHPRLGAVATSVEERAGRVLVGYVQDGIEQNIEADACVVAVPAYAAAAISPQLSADNRDILANRIRYGSIIKASHALKRRPAGNVIALSVPRPESAALGILTFEHVYRVGGIPEGCGLIASHWMHEWNKSRLDPAVSDGDIEAEMIPEVAKFVPGFADMLEFTHITRWPRASICSYPGMWGMVESFKGNMSPQGRVQYCGDYLNVPGTQASSLSGDTAARRVDALFS